MLMKSGWFLFLLTVLQVSARYKRVETDFIDYEISQEPVAVLPSSSRIISGWVAQPGQHPHHASLRMVGPNGDIRVCGGSIVSEEWVLTSGFCTVRRILAVVRAGVVDLTNPEYIFETTEWYIHPKYNNLTSVWTHSAYDIALVKLQRPVVYTEFVKPIQIQSRADAFRNYEGQQVYASGHGRTSATGPESDVLRWVYLRAISNTACRRTYANGVFDTTICAQHFNITSQNTCFGDNGGPLVHVGSDGVPTLIGVSYFFPSGCRTGFPSGYTRPGPFLQWIEEVLGKNTSTTPTSTNPTSPSTPTTTTTLRSTYSTSFTATSPISTITTTPTSTNPTSPSTPTTTTTPRSTSTTSNPISTTTKTPTSTNATLPSTPTTTTNPTSTDTTLSTTTNFTSNTPISTTPDATSPTSTDSEDYPPEETTTEQSEDDKEVDDSDSSESDEDDDIAQLLKRLLVDVKVKVRLNKYKVKKVVGNEINVWKQ